MRSYSFASILLLCLVLLLVDALAFYWLYHLIQPLQAPKFKIFFYTVYWVFSFGLVISILILKIRLDSIHPGRKQMLTSSLYGLTVASFIPKIIFSIIFTLFFFTNNWFFDIKWVWLLPIIAVISGIFPFIVIVYAVLKAVYRFKIHRDEVPILGLPKALKDLKIVHISDLHLGSFNYRYKILDRAVGIINGLQPDIICFTGDLVNNYAWELKGWDKVLSKLEAKYGKYAVLGNHDYGDYSTWKRPKDKKDNLTSIHFFYKKIGFKLLLNESEILTIDNADIAVIGVENWGKPPFKQYGKLDKALKNVPAALPKILLSHDPTHWPSEVLNQTDINLTLAGHTHGMQMGFRYKSKKWSPIKYKYKHWAGLYKEGCQYLYVTRGLGWLGFPGRVGMRPEITLLNLKRK
ncbi:MAG: phosphohydrolase [Flavobacteriales bacterium]|nr:MAG: phosphohydrolase [Flavobacteriales bacterium]